MKDVKGRPLKIGDEVSFIKPYHRALGVGRVIKLNPTGATIAWGEGNKTPRHSEAICLIALEDTSFIDSTSRGFGLIDIRKYIREQLEAYIGDLIETRAASEQYKNNLEKLDFSIKLDVDASAPPPYKLTQRSKENK